MGASMAGKTEPPPPTPPPSRRRHTHTHITTDIRWKNSVLQPKTFSDNFSFFLFHVVAATAAAAAAAAGGVNFFYWCSLHRHFSVDF